MNIIRGVAAIVIGYLVIAFVSMSLGGVVMARGGLGIVVLALVALAISGGMVGLMTRLISGRNPRASGFTLAGLVSIATLANLVLGLGAEPAWFKIGTLLVSAPAIVFVCLRQAK